MKYLCMVYYDEKNLEALSKSEANVLDTDSLGYDDELRNSGHLIAAQALMPVSTATTLRVKNGKVSITDGPFAETHEQLGGFVLIEARDLNESIQIASKLPPAFLGCIEIRPVKELRRT